MIEEQRGKTRETTAKIEAQIKKITKYIQAKHGDVELDGAVAVEELGITPTRLIRDIGTDRLPNLRPESVSRYLIKYVH